MFVKSKLVCLFAIIAVGAVITFPGKTRIFRGVLDGSFLVRDAVKLKEEKKETNLPFSEKLAVIQSLKEVNTSDTKEKLEEEKKETNLPISEKLAVIQSLKEVNASDTKEDEDDDALSFAWPRQASKPRGKGTRGASTPKSKKDDAEKSKPKGENGTTTRSAPVLTDSKVEEVPFFNLNGQRWGVHSAVVRRKSQPQDYVFWLVVNWISIKPNPNCDFILDYLQPSKLQELANQHEPPLDANQTTVKLLITDSSDFGSSARTGSCARQVAQRIGAQNVHLASRHLVQGRNFSCFDVKNQTCSTDTPFSQLNGTLWRYGPNIKKYIHNGVIAKWDFPIRPEYLRLLKERLREKLNLGDKNMTASEEADLFQSYQRKGDVAHFWKVEPKDSFGQLRNRVTQTIQELISSNNNLLTGIAGLVSERNKKGRTSTSNAYADALLDHKIVVTSQRDHWEDHLRLMEGLISGAMVMSDPVTHLPAGLKDGENVVIFQSLGDLKDKLLYYLTTEQGQRERVRIAKAGRKVALDLHQSKHRYERLMLGDNWPTDWRNPVAAAL